MIGRAMAGTRPCAGATCIAINRSRAELEMSAAPIELRRVWHISSVQTKAMRVSKAAIQNSLAQYEMVIIVMISGNGRQDSSLREVRQTISGRFR